MKINPDLANFIESLKDYLNAKIKLKDNFIENKVMYWSKSEHEAVKKEMQSILSWIELWENHNLV